MTTLNRIGVGFLIFRILGCSIGQGQTTDSSAGNDSVVQITAESQGLSQVSYDQLPFFGTYWLTSPGGPSGLIFAPLPTPTFDTTLPVYNIVGNEYLVDDTGGQVLTARMATNATSAVVAAAVQLEFDTVSNLITQIQAAEAPTPLTMTTTDSGASFPPLPGGGGGDTSGGNPVGVTNSYNFGTNLWVGLISVVSGYLNGFGSNTVSGVSYAVESVADLAQAQNSWQYESTIVGSYVTNWTPLSVPQYDRTNLFIRLKSEQSTDGSGIPDWWEAQYGLSNVDPNAQDSAGDGYTIYQKYQLNVAPGSWLTPTAPEGFTAVYNGNNDSTLLNWLPSPGPVTGYTVERTDASGNSTISSLPATSTSMTANQTLNGSIEAQSFSVQANYAGGNSAWSTLNVQNFDNFTASAINGKNGYITFVLSDLPVDLSTLRVYRYSQQSWNGSYWTWPDVGSGTTYPADLADGYFDIPVANITNGIAVVPAAEAFNFGQYIFELQTIRSNGVSSALNTSVNVMNSDVFVDGRQQLKDNLRFRLRAASDNGPFEIYPYLEPTNYVYAGFYPSYNNALNFTSLYPFQENNYFRNLLFNVNDLVTAESGSVIDNDWQLVGMPNTGVEYMGFFYDDMGGAYFADNWLQDANPEYSPQPDLSSLVTTTYPETVPTSWLTASQSQWFVPLSAYLLGGLPAGYQNYWGLSYSSQLDVAYTNNQFVLMNQSPGSPPSGNDSVMTYYNFDQPIFQTDSYYFGRVGIDPLPEQNTGLGSQYYRQNIFSITNATPPYIFVPVGGSVNIAGYAKLAVQNANPGVYGYLGQYFDQAYTTINGEATGTNTGILSPYGNFFATQPGQIALLTMPDIDPPYQRGTCMVYSVSMQVDKNHDGAMDGTFNGLDWTSQSSPMEFWINNDNDQAGAFGHVDFNAQVPPALPNYLPTRLFPSGHITCPRDLENFARLWICGIPVLTNNYQVTLSWNVTSGSPAINLYNSVETNGGTGYLTDTNIAHQQCLAYATGTPPFGIASSGPGAAIASVSSSSSYTFPANSFTNGGNQYFLFEGAGIGSGQLVMTIADQNNNIVGQTGVWLDLHDVKDFYERMVITNNITGAVSNWNCAMESETQASVLDQNLDTNMIVFVHGANNPYWKYLVLGDTVFKRLYWENYHGKLMTVRWPSPVLIPSVAQYGLQGFNYSEVIAYKAGSVLKDYLNELHGRLPNYQMNIMTESLGGAVVSEALKEGAAFNNLLLCSVAVSANCYDVNAPTDSDLLADESGSPTPLWQPMGYEGAYTNITSGRLVNYFNVNDSLMKYWKVDQGNLKPGPYYHFDGTNVYNDSDPDHVYVVTDSQESRGLAARSRTLAIGGIGPASGQTSQGVVQSAIDLQAQFNIGPSWDEHSAYYTRPIQTSLPLFQQYLIQIRPSQ